MTGIASDLARACDDLAAGRLPDANGRALILGKINQSRHTQADERTPRSKADCRRRRDELLRALADVHFRVPDAPRRIHEMATAYIETRWHRDKSTARCPADIEKKPEGYVWRALSAYPLMPQHRQLRNILQ